MSADPLDGVPVTLDPRDVREESELDLWIARDDARRNAVQAIESLRRCDEWSTAVAALDDLRRLDRACVASGALTEGQRDDPR